MINPFKKIITYIKNKFAPKKVKLPPRTTKEIVAELEIQNELRRLLSGFHTTYNNLFMYNPDKEYWVNFVTACAYVESNYDRNCKYMEPSPLNYYSLGLLQLSYVDQNHYTFCDLSGDKIFKVSNNLSCGLGILNKLVGKYKKPVFGSGHYWSVLMPKNKSRHEKFKIKFLQLCNETGVRWDGKF